MASTRLSMWVWVGLPHPLHWSMWASLANQSTAPPCPWGLVQGWACDWPRPRKLQPGALSSLLCCLHSRMMTLQLQVAVFWGLGERLSEDVDRQTPATQLGLLDQAVPEENSSTQTNRLSSCFCQFGLDADTCY